jgi:uncharacterized protein involved in cysteine biosynthesis
MLLDAFLKAIGQLRDPAIRRIVWFSLLIAAVIFVLLWAAVGFVFTQTTLFQTGWLEGIVDVLGGLATVVLTWLLFPAVVTLAMGFFLEDVAETVERRYYPLLPAARRQPVDEVVLGTLKFLGVTVALNIAALLFLLVPPVFPFVFFGINGYLLGREYFEVAALRRCEPDAALALRRQHRRQVFLAGLVITALLTVPFVNLLAPVVGTAAMVHLFHRLRIAS